MIKASRMYSSTVQDAPSTHPGDCLCDLSKTLPLMRLHFLDFFINAQHGSSKGKNRTSPGRLDSTTRYSNLCPASLPC